ncbi:hypothetical protein BESB_080560 [Besnoitia besnoiti]|uniref:Uncharacterized protein n=1 Tax=Besnoitia besnoiti TaxID=94643 RepID=A0A2A9MEN4_BESBE|nr:hypothetical protein BESB_080560 [Besnoitia besnoiti]PFH33840.1 hypothetical protein BESB_080560 [Besnoitia besnoiti]
MTEDEVMCSAQSPLGSAQDAQLSQKLSGREQNSTSRDRASARRQQCQEDQVAPSSPALRPACESLKKDCFATDQGQSRGGEAARPSRASGCTYDETEKGSGLRDKANNTVQGEEAESRSRTHTAVQQEALMSHETLSDATRVASGAPSVVHHAHDIRREMGPGGKATGLGGVPAETLRVNGVQAAPGTAKSGTVLKTRLTGAAADLEFERARSPARATPVESQPGACGEAPAASSHSGSPEGAAAAHLARKHERPASARVVAGGTREERSRREADPAGASPTRGEACAAACREQTLVETQTTVQDSGQTGARWALKNDASMTETPNVEHMADMGPARVKLPMAKGEESGRQVFHAPSAGDCVPAKGGTQRTPQARPRLVLRRTGDGDSADGDADNLGSASPLSASSPGSRLVRTPPIAEDVFVTVTASLESPVAPVPGVKTEHTDSRPIIESGKLFYHECTLDGATGVCSTFRDVGLLGSDSMGPCGSELGFSSSRKHVLSEGTRSLFGKCSPSHAALTGVGSAPHSESSNPTYDRREPCWGASSQCRCSPVVGGCSCRSGNALCSGSVPRRDTSVAQPDINHSGAAFAPGSGKLLNGDDATPEEGDRAAEAKKGCSAPRSAVTATMELCSPGSCGGSCSHADLSGSRGDESYLFPTDSMGRVAASSCAGSVRESGRPSVCPSMACALSVGPPQPARADAVPDDEVPHPSKTNDSPATPAVEMLLGVKSHCFSEPNASWNRQFFLGPRETAAAAIALANACEETFICLGWISENERKDGRACADVGSVRKKTKSKHTSLLEAFRGTKILGRDFSTRGASSPHCNEVGDDPAGLKAADRVGVQDPSVIFDTASSALTMRWVPLDQAIFAQAKPHELQSRRGSSSVEPQPADGRQGDDQVDSLRLPVAELAERSSALLRENSCQELQKALRRVRSSAYPCEESSGDEVAGQGFLAGASNVVDVILGGANSRSGSAGRCFEHLGQTPRACKAEDQVMEHACAVETRLPGSRAGGAQAERPAPEAASKNVPVGGLACQDMPRGRDEVARPKKCVNVSASALPHAGPCASAANTTRTQAEAACASWNVRLSCEDTTIHAASSPSPLASHRGSCRGQEAVEKSSGMAKVSSVTVKTREACSQLVQRGEVPKAGKPPGTLATSARSEGASSSNAASRLNSRNSNLHRKPAKDNSRHGDKHSGDDSGRRPVPCYGANARGSHHCGHGSAATDATQRQLDALHAAAAAVLRSRIEGRKWGQTNARAQRHASRSLVSETSTNAARAGTAGREAKDGAETAPHASQLDVEKCSRRVRAEGNKEKAVVATRTPPVGSKGDRLAAAVDGTEVRCAGAEAKEDTGILLGSECYGSRRLTKLGTAWSQHVPPKHFMERLNMLTKATGTERTLQRRVSRTAGSSQDLTMKVRFKGVSGTRQENHPMGGKVQQASLQAFFSAPVPRGGELGVTGCVHSSNALKPLSSKHLARKGSKRLVSRVALGSSSASADAQDWAERPNGRGQTEWQEEQTRKRRKLQSLLGIPCGLEDIAQALQWEGELCGLLGPESPSASLEPADGVLHARPARNSSRRQGVLEGAERDAARERIMALLGSNASKSHGRPGSLAGPREISRVPSLVSSSVDPPSYAESVCSPATDAQLRKGPQTAVSAGEASAPCFRGCKTKGQDEAMAAATDSSDCSGASPCGGGRAIFAALLDTKQAEEQVPSVKTDSKAEESAGHERSTCAAGFLRRLSPVQHGATHDVAPSSASTHAAGFAGAGDEDETKAEEEQSPDEGRASGAAGEGAGLPCLTSASWSSLRRFSSRSTVCTTGSFSRASSTTTSTYDLSPVASQIFSAWPASIAPTDKRGDCSDTQAFSALAGLPSQGAAAAADPSAAVERPLSDRSVPAGKASADTRRSLSLDLSGHRTKCMELMQDTLSAADLGDDGGDQSGEKTCSSEDSRTTAACVELMIEMFQAVGEEGAVAAAASLLEKTEKDDMVPQWEEGDDREDQSTSSWGKAVSRDCRTPSHQDVSVG